MGCSLLMTAPVPRALVRLNVCRLLLSVTIREGVADCTEAFPITYDQRHCAHGHDCAGNSKAARQKASDPAAGSSVELPTASIAAPGGAHSDAGGGDSSAGATSVNHDETAQVCESASCMCLSKSWDVADRYW